MLLTPPEKIMRFPSLPLSAIAALCRLVERGVLPNWLDAQLLGAASLITQEQPGPVRPTELALEYLRTLGIGNS